MNHLKHKNIIFDLGDVIIDIDIHVTLGKLAAYFNVTLEQIKEKLWDSTVWHLHEKGQATDQDIINYVNQAFSSGAKVLTTEAFYHIWNALLLQIPPTRLLLLKKLAETHALYLLSNTNATHIEYVNQLLKNTYNSPPIESYFTKAYCSYNIGMRKPDAEIYEFVLSDAQIKAEETLFFDDNEQNVAAARQIGIEAIQIIPRTRTITDLITI